MRITSQFANERRGSRPGFTLLELMIVIAIIAILAALTTGVAMRFFGIQQQRNTEVTITKANETLKRQWNEVVSEAMKEPLPPDGPSIGDPSYLSSMKWVYLTQILGTSGPSPTGLAGGDPVRARVIWVKARLRQQFPMDYQEILYATPPALLGLPQSATWQPYPPGALPALPTYYKPLINAGVVLIPPSAPPPPPTDAENSSCLLMALSLTRGGIAFSSDNLGSSAVGDTDNNGLLEILDGWKRPIRFFRWPTLNSEVENLNPVRSTLPSNPGLLFRFNDPEDPTGQLLNLTWWSATHPYTPTGPPYPAPSWAFETTFHSLYAISAGPPPPSGPAPPGWPYYPQTGPPYPAGSGPFPNTPFPYWLVPYEYYMYPVVASAGPNKSFGLMQTAAGFPNAMGSDNSGDDNDNIYSYRLRLGAPGN